MSKTRSPNYPATSLPDAVERVRQVFETEHRTPIAKEALAEVLGYSGLNGASLRVIAALSSYGLLEHVDGDYRVSDLAMQVLHPETDTERAAALKEALKSPSLFAELLERYGNSTPGKENLRTYLVRRGFSTKAANAASSAYLDSVEFALSDVSAGETMSERMRATDETKEPEAAAGGRGVRTAANAHRHDEERIFLQGELGGGVSYRITVSEGFGPKQLNKLLKILEVQKSILDEPGEDE
jgi:hypothetical protein